MLPDSPFRRSTTDGQRLVTRLLGAADDDHELYREEDAFVLTVELPGFARDDIDLRWHDDQLHLTAERDGERDSRRYARRFRFPERVDADEATATYRNGVLEVRLPVAEEREPGRTIEVAGA